jgi:hypothetical protein
MTAPATQARPTRREIARAVIRASWLDGTFDAATVAIFASGRMTRAGVRRWLDRAVERGSLVSVQRGGPAPNLYRRPRPSERRRRR